MSTTLPQLLDEVLESAFLNGLDPILRAEVLTTEPNGLDQIMKRAQLIEDVSTAIQGVGKERTSE